MFCSYRCSQISKYTRNDVKSSSPLEFIVPNKPLNVLKNILDDNKSSVKIDYNTSNAIFKFSNYKLVCRLIEGKYPNYDAVIPKENPNVLEIDRNQLLQATKRASIFQVNQLIK